MTGSRESERRKCTTRLCNCSKSSEFIDDKLSQRIRNTGYWSRPCTWHSSFQTLFARNTAKYEILGTQQQQEMMRRAYVVVGLLSKNRFLEQVLFAWNLWFRMAGVCGVFKPHHPKRNEYLRNETTFKCSLIRQIWVEEILDGAREYLTWSRLSGNRSRGELIWITNARICTRSRISLFCSGCAPNHKNGTAPNRKMCMLEGKHRIEHDSLFGGLSCAVGLVYVTRNLAHVDFLAYHNFLARAEFSSVYLHFSSFVILAGK